MAGTARVRGEYEEIIADLTCFWPPEDQPSTLQTSWEPLGKRTDFDISMYEFTAFRGRITALGNWLRGEKPFK